MYMCTNEFKFLGWTKIFVDEEGKHTAQGQTVGNQRAKGHTEELAQTQTCMRTGKCTQRQNKVTKWTDPIYEVSEIELKYFKVNHAEEISECLNT